MSSLPSHIKRIGSKTTEKRWRHRFPHYKSMGAFCCHGNQSFVLRYVKDGSSNQLHHIAFDKLKSHTPFPCPATQSINICLKSIIFTIANTIISNKSYFERNMSRIVTKPTKWHMRLVETQISLGMRPV